MSRHWKPQSSQLHGKSTPSLTCLKRVFMLTIAIWSQVLTSLDGNAPQTHSSTLLVATDRSYRMRHQLLHRFTKILEQTPRYPRTQLSSWKLLQWENSNDQLRAYEEYNTYAYEPCGGTPTVPQSFYSSISNKILPATSCPIPNNTHRSLWRGRSLHCMQTSLSNSPQTISARCRTSIKAS